MCVCVTQYIFISDVCGGVLYTVGASGEIVSEV